MIRLIFSCSIFGYVGCGQAEKSQEDSGVFDEEPSFEDTAQEPEANPTSEPTSEPESSPTAEPTSEPAEEPVEEDCPQGVICTSTFPYSHMGDTSQSTAREFDSYSCAPSTDESGTEIYYRLTIPESGFLALELSEMESGADVDVHLLASLDSGDCIDRGHWLAGSWVTSGTYWVVADSWVNSSGTELSGAYTLRVGLTTEEDLMAEGIDADVAEDAIVAFDVAWLNGEISSFVYSITDFSLHSAQERFWIYDLAGQELLYNLYVAHGQASSDSNDASYASTFSNIPESHQSSLGMMRGAESYTGSFGYSMRIDGLESGFNDNVRPRAIVMHGWEGSRPEYVAQYGMTAPTLGCPAVDDREVADVVDLLKDGSGMFFWYPGTSWYSSSEYLGN